MFLKRGGGIVVDYFVEVVDWDSGEAIKRLGPMTKRKAERVDDGLNINLDHDRYHTRIVGVRR